MWRLNSSLCQQWLVFWVNYLSDVFYLSDPLTATPVQPFFLLDSTADYQIIDDCFSCSTWWHSQNSTSGRSPAIITFSTMHSTDKVLAFHPPAREITMRPWRFRSCARNPIRLSLARFLLLWPVRGWSGEWCMLFINLHCSPRGQLPAGGRIRAPCYLQHKPYLVIFGAGINPALTQCWYNVGPASQTLDQHCINIGWIFHTYWKGTTLTHCKATVNDLAQQWNKFA